MKSILLSALLLLGCAQANEKEYFFVQTQTFATKEFHQLNVLDEASTAGLVVGWVVFGIAVVISFALVLHNTIVRSKEYDTNLVTAQAQMRRLGINVLEADREFDEMQKGHKKAEEQFDLIEVALNEGKRIKEGGSRGAANRI